MASINLMSLQSRRQEKIRTRVRQWGRTLLALSALLGVITGERYLAYHHAAQEQLVLEAAYEPIVELKAANRQLSKQIAAIHREEQFVLSLSEQEPTITLLGILGKTVADGKDRVFLQKIELNNFTLASGESAEKRTVVDLVGTAQSGAAVNELAAALRGAVSFGTVDVDSTRQYRVQQQTMQDFSLQCTY